MLPDIKRTILANMNVKLYLMTTYISQGSAATDLKGGESFNSNFLQSSLMNLTVKKYANWSTFVEVVAHQIWPGTFDTRCTYMAEGVFTSFLGGSIEKGCVSRNKYCKH